MDSDPEICSRVWATPDHSCSLAGDIIADRRMLAFDYKSSPFYEIVARIGDVRVCDGLFT